MSVIILIAITLVSASLLYKFLSKGPGHKKLPSGSVGLPLIGESVSFLRAQSKDKGQEWLNERMSKHGPVFKTSILGSPTIVIIGQAGNKFVLTTEDNVLSAKQPLTLRNIGGRSNIFELTGSRYKLVKGAMVSFLKPESLQNYVRHMDGLVRTLLLKETRGKDTIKAVDCMKKLTFNLACNILFGIPDEPTEEALCADFKIAFRAIYSIPLNFPGTRYWKGLQARSRIADHCSLIMKKKKKDLSSGILSPTSDVMCCLLALRDENQEPLSDEEVIDNIVTLMIASHDTSAILLSLMIWKLAREPEIYKKILEEQLDIVQKREGTEDRLTWAEIQKMKYTWRVAQELMRIIPPVFGSFRKALKDTSFDGYDIPKGWQVLWAACGTHMNTEIFDDPEEFDPSRFENRPKPIPPFAYLPFGGGIRTCIGNEFARVETLTAIHNLVRMFEWTQVNPEEIITRQPMPYPSMGLPIKLKPRNPF